MRKIKIFTQNLYWMDFLNKTRRMREVRRYVRDKKFDFVFLQEAVLGLDVKIIKRHNFAYYTSGRLGPRGGLAILSKKKLDRIEFYKFEEQGTIFTRQIFDRLVEKGFLVGYIGENVYINTHLICPYEKESRKNVENLNKQFEQLLNFVKEKIKHGKKIVLGGDFNFKRSSKKYKKITKLLTDNTIPPKSKMNQNNAEQIDFIFSSEKNSRNYVQPIYPIFVSDHEGIGIELIKN
jgi:endonuclease/exonuclease/phosphatase family metal-dependent hydrolase